MPENTSPASDEELRKIKLENRKLELDIADAERPVWQKPTVWISYVSAVVGIAVGVYQFQKSDIEFQRAELKKEQAEHAAAEATEAKKRLDKDIAALSESKAVVEGDYARLSTVVTELTTLLRSSTKLKELVQSSSLEGTLRSVIYPLTVPLDPSAYPKIPGSNRIVTRDVRIVLNESGHAIVTVNFASVLEGPSILPSFKIVVKSLDGKEITPVSEFPPLPVQRKNAWPVASFQAKGEHKFQLEPAISAKVIAPSQLSAE